MNKFKRWCTAVAVSIGLIGACVLGSAEPASAFGSQNTNWLGGYAFTNTYSVNSPVSTVGYQMYGQNTGHYYMVIARHTVENGGWGGSFCGNPCGAVYQGSWANYFDSTQVYFPWAVSGGIDYTKFDMALVDLGTSPAAGTDFVHNWCKPYPSCEGPYGGGSAAPTNVWTQGYNMNTVGNTGNSWVGMLSCHSGMKSGTSCGYISQSYFWVDNGYQSWVWIVPNMGNCGSAEGDSSSPVYYTTDAVNIYMAGHQVGGENPYIVGSQNACYGAGVKAATGMAFIPWTSVAAGFPTVGLVPLT